jgi:hypothetical protein
LVRALAISLAALLIASGLGFLVYATTSQYNVNLLRGRSINLGVTVKSQATTVAAIAQTARPLATAQAGIYASATAQLQASATAAATGDSATATVTAMGSLLTQDTTGTADLDDPLSDNSLNNKWNIGYSDNNNTGCNFVNSNYQVQEALRGFVHTCFAEATSFNNFVYQVSMTITAGNEGGILFRGSSANTSGQYYLFRIDINGAYIFEVYNGGSYTMLANGTSSAITTGLSQSNDLAVIADKGTFDLFVNATYVAGVNDKTLTSGQIGVAAYATNLPTTVTFSNARVWKLS